MDERVMTNDEIEMWRAIGADIGLKFDELGHPYREGEHYEIEGHPYRHLYDWRPLEDDGDAFRLQVHYGLMINIQKDGVTVHDASSAILAYCFYSDFHTADACARKAVFQGAYKLINKRYVERASREPIDRAWD